MLLNITTTSSPATDLGFLLHKHPDSFKAIKLSTGKAYVFYPEADQERTTISLLLDINPIETIKGHRHVIRKGFSLGQYVNDRPFVTSSFMSVAIAKAFSTAMNGSCKAKPELVNKALDFDITLSVVHASAGKELIHSLFEPLGYKLEVEEYLLDTSFENWGKSKYFTVKLKHQITLKELLSHLYVLLPVLDNDKHYFIHEEEREKLLKKGEGWLDTHPKMELIVKRYLLHLKSLSKIALNELTPDELEDEFSQDPKVKEQKKRKETLNQKRLQAIIQEVNQLNISSIADLGCGEGKLLAKYIKNRHLKKIAGMDVSYSELLKAKERIYYDNFSPKQKERVHLFQSSIFFKDERLRHYEALSIIEVIEHLDEDKLQIFKEIIFQYLKPKYVLITTPNIEYNTEYHLSKDKLRHPDHRFEWTRKEFETWCNVIANDYGYRVTFKGIGDQHEALGTPTQMGVFTYDN